MIRIHRDANGLHGFQTTGLAQKPCPATPLMCRMAYESITADSVDGKSGMSGLEMPRVARSNCLNLFEIIWGNFEI